jgi:hypothetical protein
MEISRQAENSARDMVLPHLPLNSTAPPVGTNTDYELDFYVSRATAALSSNIVSSLPI